MSFDTKYRPLLFSEVIGQQGTVSVLKKLLQTEQIFHKSYIFAGPSGTGKTTTARILARAMLCDDVTEEGEPCNQCESCRSIIEGTSSFSFVEMDAANNSNVDTIRQIIEGIDYYTVDGKDRRIYLLDEAHRLSKEAMDALLKPMEDSIPGSKDKRLVCLFCTTEPEKLRDTIKARCMMFGIQEPEKDEVVARLKWICEKESIEYEPEALDIIFSYGRGHIRDMVNALERVSQIGDVTCDNVREQLGLSAVSNYYEILSQLRDDLPSALSLTRKTLHLVDASTLYEGLADAAMASYRVSKDITEGVGYVDRQKAADVYSKYADSVLWIADRILGTRKKIDENVLVCEIVLIHRFLNGGTIFDAESVQTNSNEPSPVRSTRKDQKSLENAVNTEADSEKETESDSNDTNTIEVSPVDVERFRKEASTVSKMGDRFVKPDGPSKAAIEEREKESNTKVPKHFSGSEVRDFYREIFDD